MDDQYVYRQRFTVEVIWATAAPDDAFDDALGDMLSMGAHDMGGTVIWRVEPSPAERMGETPRSVSPEETR